MNSELQDKINRAIEVLRENEPKDGKGYDLKDVARVNLLKLRSRAERGTISGEGGYR